MENKYSIAPLIVALLLSTNLTAQKKKNIDSERGYAFEGRNLVIQLSSGFFGDSYGYGKLSGTPLKVQVEYGVHRYVGLALYGGMLHRDPQLGEQSFQMDVYTGGLHVNFHLYNFIDDLTKKNLRGDIIDVYGTFTVGMDYFDTNLPFRNKYAYFFTGGLGVRAYPIKKAKDLGFNMEFSAILSPWLIGLNYRF